MHFLIASLSLGILEKIHFLFSVGPQPPKIALEVVSVSTAKSPATLLQYSGGTLFTQFSHFIDMIYWLFGDININNVILKDFNHSSLTDFEDSGIVNFYLKDGGIGSIKPSSR